jgi:hypothetical protein
MRLCNIIDSFEDNERRASTLAHFRFHATKKVYFRSTQVTNSRVLRIEIKNSKTTICLDFQYLTFTKIKNAKKLKIKGGDRFTR